MLSLKGKSPAFLEKRKKPALIHIECFEVSYLKNHHVFGLLLFFFKLIISTPTSTINEHVLQHCHKEEPSLSKEKFLPPLPVSSSITSFIHSPSACNCYQEKGVASF